MHYTIFKGVKVLHDIFREDTSELFEVLDGWAGVCCKLMRKSLDNRGLAIGDCRLEIDNCRLH